MWCNRLLQVRRDSLQIGKERVIGSAPLSVGAGAAESAGRKAKRFGVLVEVLRDRQRILEVGVV